MSSSELEPPIIVIEKVDDENSTKTVDENAAKYDVNTGGTNNLSGDETGSSNTLATLKIPPPEKPIKESRRFDVVKQETSALTVTSKETSKLETPKTNAQQALPNGPSSPRQRHPSKEEELKHLTEEVGGRGQIVHRQIIFLS